MARKPNYKFERLQRERNKAAKKEARRAAKEERKNLGEDGTSPATLDMADAEPGESGESESDIE